MPSLVGELAPGYVSVPGRGGGGLWDSDTAMFSMGLRNGNLPKF